MSAAPPFVAAAAPLLRLACSVCYGDPASPLTEGAKAGVLFLGAVIVGLLAAIAGVIVFWARRARKLEAAPPEPRAAPAATVEISLRPGLRSAPR